jgi:tetratricopeptide (TPR) repeat protein
LKNLQQITRRDNHGPYIFRISGGTFVTVKEAEELIRKGRAYASRTKYKEAIAYYERALALDPDNPSGWYHRAAVFIETGRNTEALADCERAISLNQNYSDAWSKKGHALYNLERYEESVVACTRALALNGNDASAWYIKGVCLDELGRNIEAQEAYGKSLELEIILDMEAEKKKIGG